MSNTTVQAGPQIDYVTSLMGLKNQVVARAAGWILRAIAQAITFLNYAMAFKQKFHRVTPFHHAQIKSTESLSIKLSKKGMASDC